MILVIEDDEMINSLLCKVLSDSGYETESAANGIEGLELARNKDHELILLDLMLPFRSGEEVLRELRKTKDTPVIVLSAKNEVINRIDLLRMGADDYICKPFDVDEVILRINAVLRRTGKSEAPSAVYKDMRLDKEAKTASLAKKKN